MTADADKDAEKEEHFSTVGGVVNWYNHSKSVWRFLRNMDIVLTEDPVILFLDIYPRDAPT